MSILLMKMASKFSVISILSCKTVIVSVLLGIRCREIDLLNLINGDLVPTAGVLDIGETVRWLFLATNKDMDESKRVINYLQEVADEVKTTVGTTNYHRALGAILFLFYPWNRLPSLWWEKETSST